MMFVPINVTKTHWQVMVIMNTVEQIKETEVLSFDSQLRSFDPHEKHHINCDADQATAEFEIHFLRRHLAEILAQD